MDKDQGSRIKDQGSGEDTAVGAAIGRPPEADALDSAVGAAIGRPPAEKTAEPAVGAAIGRPPEAAGSRQTTAGDAKTKKPEIGRGWVTRFFYPILWWILRIALALYHWPSFRGRENLPEGPCVICGNHSGFADPLWVFLLMKTRMPPWTMARSSLFEKSAFARNFLLSFRAFPVDRDNVDLAAVKKSLSVLKNGEKLLIFPEGTRVKKGKRSEPKSGAVLLAQRAGVPLVPVYITHGRKPFQPIRVVMGEAWTPQYSSRRPDAAELERHTAELMGKIYELGKSSDKKLTIDS